MKSFYEYLDVHRDASDAEIRLAYKRRVNEVHPDRGGNTIDFLNIQKGYSILSDPSKRLQYDRWLMLREHQERKTVIPDATNNDKSNTSYRRKSSSGIFIYIMLLAVFIVLFVAAVVKSCNEYQKVEYIISDENKLRTVVAEDEESSIIAAEEYNSYESSDDAEDYDDNQGETYTYYPEDNTIRSSSGEIFSEGFSSQSARKNIVSPQKSATKVNEYEGVSIEHFLNGDYPYFDAYGKGKFDTNSLSSLSMSNQTSTDAVVLLCDAQGEVIRNVFVKKGSFYEIKHIPSCRCVIKIMFGKDWYKEKDNGPGFPKGGFTKDISYTVSKWSDAFDFIPHYETDGIDYPTYKLTLHAVPNGNFQTNHSNKNEFFNNSKDV